MEYLFALQQLREACPSWFVYACSYLCDFLAFAALIFPVVIYWCADKASGQWMLLNFTGGYMVNQSIKNVACVNRPWLLDSRLKVASCAAKTATGYSFPSGHTAAGTLVYESLAVWQRRRKGLVILYAFIIAFIAFVRNFAGAHTFRDVSCAIIISSLIIILNIFIVKFLQDNPSKDIIAFIIAAVIATGVFIFLILKPYPLMLDPEYDSINHASMLKDCYSAYGRFMGFILGFLLEHRYIRFEECKTAKQKIITTVSGVAVYGVITLLGGFLSRITGINTGTLVVNFVNFLYITAIHPLVMKKTGMM